MPTALEEVQLATQHTSYSNRLPSNIANSNLDKKKIIKIVRHLRDDLSRIFPNELMPSSWIIRCLIESCYTESHGLSWQASVLHILRSVSENTASRYGVNTVFFQEDGVTPLFPNKEDFSPSHAHTFANLAHKYLKLQQQNQDITKYLYQTSNP
ncbi:hypothetical protein [Teredinibacter sp. KSP-S5-2]|uniref:hypothetical protein n=1 Tax=Teredinibacter sp. KSP-S5-2 TaxID=3034506 RepID=UPI0029344C93|nr:hypothetical protein [Teredinibacter sp. KSP-S5-2]WNO10163.1 hypothetical protein P5V12_03155 [Teredinibacter sp. KSP-S5-2]